MGAAAAAAKSLQSCPTLCDPMDCRPPGFSIHGIFWATVLEWGVEPKKCMMFHIKVEVTGEQEVREESYF